MRKNKKKDVFYVKNRADYVIIAVFCSVFVIIKGNLFFRYLRENEDKENKYDENRFV